MSTLNQDQINIITQAMKDELDYPHFYYTSSPAAYTEDRIAVSDPNLAKEFWSWHCKTTDFTWVNNDPEFIHYYQLLEKAFDKVASIPSWGTYGT